MEKNPLDKSVPTSSPTRSGPVTRAMVHARAQEIASTAGRAPPEVTPSDHQQARRELTGESELDRQDAILDAIPESERWDPVPGSAGSQAPESSSEDEDDEGRSETEQMVDQGAEEADRERMLQAAKVAKKDK